MKTLLLASLACLLLVAGPIYAEEKLYTDDEVQHAIKDVLTTIAPRINHDRDCLASMEKAMRAVDPWIGETSAFDTDKGTAYRNAKALWNKTRRECWKEKP